VGPAVQRAEHKTQAMPSRAGAIDELLASGALDDLSKSNDHLDAELSRAVASPEVEAELARLKAELPVGLAPAPAMPLEPGETP
jgi:phage shock protein A